MNYSQITFPYQPRNYDNRMKPLAPQYRTRLVNWLWATRRQAHLSQDELAERAGISRRTIHAIETDKQWPSVVIALKLAEALGTDVNKLFCLREPICCSKHIPYAMRQAARQPRHT